MPCLPRVRMPLLILLAALSGAPRAAAAPPAPGSGTLIVLNKAGASASLIDLATRTTVATLPTGDGPHEAAVSPDGRRAVATNYGGRTPGSTLTLLDIPAAKVAATIDLGAHRRPHGIAWLPDGRRVAVTAEESRALLLVDVPAARIAAVIPTGQEVSHMVVVNRGGTRAYVSSIGSGSVTVIDLGTRAVIATIPTGAGAEGITLTPDGGMLWVTNRDADTISVIDTATLGVTATLRSAAFPIRAAATPDGRFILVSNARSGDVAVFDALTHGEHRRVAMALEPSATEGRLFADRFGRSPVPIGILPHPGGGQAYVANAHADVVAVVDLATFKVTGLLATGKEPDGMAFSHRRAAKKGDR